MRSLFTLAITVLLLAGCGGGGGAENEAGSGDVDWPHWGNVAENTHYADLDQVDRDNVGKLKVAWTRPEGKNQFAWETFPIVVGRTMYYGIYLTTADDQLIALDAKTGKPHWKTQVIDPSQGNTMNSPGAFFDGELIVGGPAGDAGLRGFVAAYDAATGKRLWRTFMIPPRDKRHPFDHSYGGGDVWMPPVVDPQTGTAYVSTGNPTPGFTNAGRPGCNPMADATVALDAKTGTIEWSHTELCNDSWDYDTVQAPTVLDLDTGSGDATRAVGAGSKAGFWTTLDAQTGDLIARSPYIGKYSRPHLRPTRKGAVVCPGIFGGI
ncbi:PQQ-binding-like beta-propeller repeat protein, partial [bacterium]|nr:PQQ-binding-like beta-propeller repeat protein [bacterium]